MKNRILKNIPPRVYGFLGLWVLGLQACMLQSGSEEEGHAAGRSYVSMTNCENQHTIVTSEPNTTICTCPVGRHLEQAERAEASEKSLLEAREDVIDSMRSVNHDSMFQEIIKTYSSTEKPKDSLQETVQIFRMFLKKLTEQKQGEKVIVELLQYLSKNRIPDKFSNKPYTVYPPTIIATLYIPGIQQCDPAQVIELISEKIDSKDALEKRTKIILYLTAAIERHCDAGVKCLLDGLHNTGQPLTAEEAQNLWKIANELSWPSFFSYAAPEMDKKKQTIITLLKPYI